MRGLRSKTGIALYIGIDSIEKEAPAALTKLDTFHLDSLREATKF